MAIVEKVGKDRRGVPVYEKDAEGAELLFENTKKWLVVDEKGNEMIRSRKEKIKRLADDLPKVVASYIKYKENN